MQEISVHPSVLPDNIFIIQMLEEESAKPAKVPRQEDKKVQQLQQGLDAGRKLVQVLRKTVPRAVEALNRQLDRSVADLSVLERVFEKVQQGEESDEQVSEAYLELASLMEDSFHLMASYKCSVVSEEGGNTWKSSVQLGPIDHNLRLLLLQLRTSNRLKKVSS